MLAEGARQAAATGITNIEWVSSRAEDLPPHLGPFRVASLAQSFHWMDRDRVARLLHAVLARDGALVHLHATTHQGIETNVALPHPRPPREEIDGLVKRFLGPQRRAGQSTLPPLTRDEAAVGREESAIYSEACFTGQTWFEVPGAVVVRSIDDVVASVFSLSSAAPHLFGDRVALFEPSFASCSPGPAPRGGSASRCSRSRWTSGTSSDPE
jgi:hypothetical protein